MEPWRPGICTWFRGFFQVLVFWWIFEDPSLNSNLCSCWSFILPRKGFRRLRKIYLKDSFFTLKDLLLLHYFISLHAHTNHKVHAWEESGGKPFRAHSTPFPTTSQPVSTQKWHFQLFEKEIQLWFSPNGSMTIGNFSRVIYDGQNAVESNFEHVPPPLHPHNIWFIFKTLQSRLRYDTWIPFMVETGRNWDCLK